MSNMYYIMDRKGLEGKFMLIGIVSLSRNCGDKEYPGLYVSLNYHRDWILDNISNDLNLEDTSNGKSVSRV